MATQVGRVFSEVTLMPLVALVCFGLLGCPDGTAPAADVVAEYQQAKLAAGRSSTDQVRLALWCEAHGLTAERLRHLAQAMMADPANITARGLSGLVARDGRWVAPDLVAREVRTDANATALLDEYNLRRSKTPYTADAQWSLGQWADDHHLTEQARAHYTAVTRLDPTRELAWKRLGYKKHDGHWTTDAQIVSARTEAEAQKQADRTWKPLLEKWRGMLAKPNQREEARAALLDVTDPRALPSVARVFGTNRASDQQVAVGLLGQIESPQATRFLAALAVFASSTDVRRASLESLRDRDPRDFIGFWISLLRAQVKYEVRPVGGPGSPGGLFVQGEKANTQRIYRPMDAPNPANYPGGMWSTGANGLPILIIERGNSIAPGPSLNSQQFEALKQQADRASAQNKEELGKLHLSSGQISQLDSFLPSGIFAPDAVKRMTHVLYGDKNRLRNEFAAVVDNQIQIPIGQMVQQAQMSAVVAQTQLTNDVARIDSYNAEVRGGTDSILLALHDITGENHGEDREGWSRWWTNEQGYAVTDSSTAQAPTFVENVPIGFTPTPVPIIQTSEVVGYAQVRRHSCFGAGTPVRTIDGTMLIEKIRLGDLVLVEDTFTGALSYQPVLTAYHNPPSTTYRIKLGNDEVVATGIHRFWKSGKGWTMVRDLKVGDSLRVLAGVATVSEVSSEKTQPVFNLEVASGRSFFVGRIGALVHDHSLVEATPDPFDSTGPVEPTGSSKTAGVAR